MKASDNRTCEPRPPGRNGLAPLDKVMLVELLGSRGFPVTRHVYGQTFLKIDLLTAMRRCGVVPVEWHLIGSGLSPATGLPGVTLWEADVRRDPLAYASVLDKLCASGAPVIAVSSFATEDSLQLLPVGWLRQQRRNLFLVVMLHCPKQEYVRDLAEAPPSYPSALQATHNARTLGWLTLLSADDKWDVVDSYVAVSDQVKASFEQPDRYLGVPLPRAEKIAVIQNGVDADLYRAAPPEFVRARREEIGLGSAFVVGTTSGWKQYKGRSVFLGILRRYARAPERSPEFLLPFLPDYSGQDLLRDLATQQLAPLVRAGRVHLFFDLAKWRKLPNYQEIACAYDRELTGALEGCQSREQEVFAACWRGTLDFPCQWLMDVYLRPSYSEGFGRGVVEARLCGIPTLTSDRGFLGWVCGRDCVTLPEGLQVGTGPDPEEDAERASDAFVRRIEDLRAARGAGTGERRCAAYSGTGPTLTRMVHAYERHFLELVGGSRWGNKTA